MTDLHALLTAPNMDEHLEEDTLIHCNHFGSAPQIKLQLSDWKMTVRCLRKCQQEVQKHRSGGAQAQQDISGSLHSQ